MVSDVNKKFKNLNVMLLITDGYTYYSLPFIYSLIKNNNWTQVEIYLLTDSLNDKNRKVFSDCIISWGGVLHILDVDTSVFDGLKTSSLYPSLLYCKLLPHKFLPDDVSRIVYFDVDMVVTGSLEEYYKTDMGDNYFGGCHDVGWFKLLYQGKAEGVYKKYINSGTVLYNLDLLRDADVSLSDYKSFLNDKKQKLYEEWLLSNVYNDKIYNFYPFDYNYNPGQREFYREYCNNTGVKAKKLVIHYMPFGNDSPIIKPWDAYEIFYNGKKNTILNPELYDLYNVWWDYAKQMPEYVLNTILLQAQQRNIERIESDRDKWHMYSDTFKGIIQNGFIGMKEIYPLADVLLQKGYKNIAIYGYMEISKVLINLINGSGINIAYIVENSPVNGIKTLHRNTPEYPKADIMLVADVANFKTIEAKLKKFNLSFPIVNAQIFLSGLKGDNQVIIDYREINKELELKRHQVVELNESYTSLKDDYNKVNSDLESMVKKFNNLNKEYDQIKDSLKVRHVELETIKKENDGLQAENLKLKSDYGLLVQKFEIAEQDKEATKNTLSATQKKLDELTGRYSDMENSASFRTGRAITYLPRKVRNLFKKNK